MTLMELWLSCYYNDHDSPIEQAADAIKGLWRWQEENKGEPDVSGKTPEEIVEMFS